MVRKLYRERESAYIPIHRRVLTVSAPRQMKNATKQHGQSRIRGNFEAKTTNESEFPMKLRSPDSDCHCRRQSIDTLAPWFLIHASTCRKLEMGMHDE